MHLCIVKTSHNPIDLDSSHNRRCDVSSEDWESMTIDQLFDLHQLMQGVLIERLKARKAEIENQLKVLNQPSKDVRPKRSRERKSA